MEIYSRGRIELIDELISPDYVAFGPGSEQNTTESPRARAVGLEAVKQSIVSKPPDISVVVEEQIAEGDKVMSRLTFSSGGESWTGIAIQRVSGGKITETWRLTNRRP
jgi:predicted ester cyclase